MESLVRALSANGVTDRAVVHSRHLPHRRHVCAAGRAPRAGRRSAEVDDAVARASTTAWSWVWTPSSVRMLATWLRAVRCGATGRPPRDAAALPTRACAGVSARQSGERQRAEHQPEVPQRDVAVAADEQEVEDDAAKP